MYDELLDFLSEYSVMDIESLVEAGHIGAGIAAEAMQIRMDIDSKFQPVVKTFDPNTYHRYSGYESVVICGEQHLK